jgi:flagellin
MTFSVNTNTNALAALESLNMTQQALTKAQNRVSTGLAVASAADDASTFAIAQGQRGDIAGFQAISSSLSMGTATLNVALQGATTISNTLNELEAKVVQSEDSTQDKNAIQNDIKSFLSQIDSTASAAQFNGVNLINGGAATTQSILSSLNRSGSNINAAFISVSVQNLQISALGISGLNVADQAMAVTIGSTFTVPASNSAITVVTTNSAGTAATSIFEFVATATTSLTSASDIAVVVGATTGSTLAAFNAAMSSHGFSSTFDTQGNLYITAADGDVSSISTTITGLTPATVTSASSSNALDMVNTAINAVKTALSALGTASNQIQTQTDFVSTLTDALTTGVGNLVDANLAAESAQLQALQTKQQLGIQALSIANQGPSAVLSLFR